MLRTDNNSYNRNNIRIALFEPRIPQNTGNIGRTCLGFDLTLDLICPLGFDLGDKYLKRAGLDYWKHLRYNVHSDFEKFKQTINRSRLLGFSKNGHNKIGKIQFKQDDILLFGREDIGLPIHIRKECSDIIEIPMVNKANSKDKHGIRSLNLSVACGIASYLAIQSVNAIIE